MLKYSRIAGTGSYLPEKVLTNQDLEKMFETSDEWIRERTGIRERHIAAEGQTTVDLGLEAARRAIMGRGEMDTSAKLRWVNDNLDEIKKWGKSRNRCPYYLIHRAINPQR